MTPNSFLIHERDQLYRDYQRGRIDAPELLRELRRLDTDEHEPSIGWLGVTLFVLVVGAAALAAVR
jgi:hypothetical protein